MNADNLGVFHEQSVAHVLNRIHRVDGRAIKVNGGDTEGTHVQGENNPVYGRNPLHVEEKSTTAQIGLVEDEDRRGDDCGPQPALVADRRLRDVGRAHDFVGRRR